jgi:predicted nuclease of predicted toxin-antitoxin system
MRFLVDECTGPAVARWLRNQGHEVFSVYEEARGLEDEAVIQKAYTENWILVTNDKGFGEKVFRERYPHKGVVLLRLEDERAGSKIETLRRLLESHADQLAGRFVTVTETQVRFASREG